MIGPLWRRLAAHPILRIVLALAAVMCVAAAALVWLYPFVDALLPWQQAVVGR